MTLRHMTVLVLAASIGCTQDTSVPDVEPVDATAGIDLPDPSATMVRFTCPGMT